MLCITDEDEKKRVVRPNMREKERKRRKKSCNKNKLYALPVAKERKKKKRSAYLTDQYKKSIEKECLEFIV